MSWWDHLWPFGKRRRERIAHEKEIETAFKRQLEEAQKRQGDLQDIVVKLKQQREARYAERARRKTFPSLPSAQETGS